MCTHLIRRSVATPALADGSLIKLGHSKSQKVKVNGGGFRGSAGTDRLLTLAHLAFFSGFFRPALASWYREGSRCPRCRLALSDLREEARTSRQEVNREVPETICTRVPSARRHRGRRLICHRAPSGPTCLEVSRLKDSELLRISLAPASGASGKEQAAIINAVARSSVDEVVNFHRASRAFRQPEADQPPLDRFTASPLA